eukprot:gb/GECG01008478.1/.p1 GENE.gb/GECG01008478.1/~~gb/GECG01008478.1/.p1  ORF type:complete len:469 (+),score=39.85 gb/GECG01008478.1/:1-1407(+)
MFLRLAKFAQRSLKFNPRVRSELYCLLPKLLSSGAYSQACFSAKAQDIEMADIVEADEEGLMKAASHLQKGGCVAFPTETVYGLGADARNEQALLNIFKFKERPLSDPLIVHLLSAENSHEIVATDEKTAPIFDALARRFWPGPLTIILPARETMPSQVSAGTGFIGVRCPEHPIARQLLEKANLPIAAPSANKFGHVSPTTAGHVYNDLSDCPIIIVKGENDTTEGHVTCSVGIESTVIKISTSGNVVEILRSGGTSAVSLLRALSEEGLTTVRVVEGGTSAASKTQPTGSGASQQSTHGNADDELQRHESPGQLLRHYAPNVTTFLLPPRQALPAQNTENCSLPEPKKILEKSALIDFAGAYCELKNHLGYYTDLSPEGDIVIARQRVYSSLREAEQIPGITTVLVSLPNVGENTNTYGSPKINIEHTDSLRDRLFRAASGRYLAPKDEDQGEIWSAVMATCLSQS